MIKQTIALIFGLILLPACFAARQAPVTGVLDPKLSESRYQALWHKSLYLGAYQFALVYGLTRMPEKTTNWTSEQRKFSNFGRNWFKHVTSSPVFDKDPIWVNYIGHPWSGANYYVMARQTGLSPKESFFYALIESTFVWEFGFEAMAERPSINDLVVTPAIGTILGELKYREIRRILANDGKLWGSKTAGSLALVALSPFNALVNATRALFRDTDQQPDVYADFSFDRQGGKTPGNRYVFQFHMAL